MGDQSPNSLATLFAIVGLSTLTSAAGAKCSAYAESLSYNLTADGAYFASFKVMAKPCKNGCSGTVRYQVSYTDKDTNTLRSGRPYWTTDTLLWKSELGEPAQVYGEGKILSCDDEINPCQQGRDVKVERVSCID